MTFAKPGMVLALPVFHPKRQDTVLLKGGVRLEQQMIGRLREIELPEMWIRYPRLDALSKFVSPEIMQSRGEVVLKVAEAFDAASTNASARLDYLEYKRAVEGLISKLAEQPAAALYLGDSGGSHGAMVQHAGNTAFLSILIGLKIGFYLEREREKLSAVNARDVTSLGVGAMLHDIGVTQLDNRVRETFRMTGDESDMGWRQHVKLGHELVKGQIEPSAAACVLHHHQQFDGLGFPGKNEAAGEDDPLEGREIHVFARIVAAAELYDRLRNGPAPAVLGLEANAGMPGVRALSLMQQSPLADRLDPIVYLGLVQAAPPYAPGDRVTLSNGERGVVVSWSLDDPCRPRVALIDADDPEGATEVDPDASLSPDAEIDAEVIDLTLHPDLEVSEVGGEGVQEYNFYAGKRSLYGLGLIEKAMSEMPRAAA